MHPLSPNTQELSDQELSEKISTLERRLVQCYRMNQPALINQISMLLEDFRHEHRQRVQKQLETALKQTGKSLDSIIDIK